MIIACYKFKEVINFYLNEDLPGYCEKTSFYGARPLLKPLMLKLQRVFFENLSTLISFSDVLEMNKSILFDSLCLALLKSRKILRGECYSEFLDFELESEGFLRKIVLDRIEKRMSLNFKSEFIDLVYYQSFENCMTISEIEPSEPSKIDKLECCGKVL